VFRKLAVRGQGGTLVWGYRTAAALRTWTITRDTDPKRGPWRLSASLARVDRFQIRQRPLIFTAPRLGGGTWCWPVLDIQVGTEALLARLGPPEQ
jgi:hypothetical protein